MVSLRAERRASRSAEQVGDRVVRCSRRSRGPPVVAGPEPGPARGSRARNVVVGVEVDVGDQDDPVGCSEGHAAIVASSAGSPGRAPRRAEDVSIGHGSCVRASSPASLLAPVSSSTGAGAALASHGPNRGGGSVDPNAHPGQLQAQITFVKKPATRGTAGSRGTRSGSARDGTWKVLAQDSWRAGSGLPGGSATNSCVKGHGWLPNGTLLAAAVRRLRRQPDPRPGLPARRQALRERHPARAAVHPHRGRRREHASAPTRPGDQICRWEYPKINDYTSHGCIKMSPADILALTRDYHRFFQRRRPVLHRPGVSSSLR